MALEEILKGVNELIQTRDFNRVYTGLSFLAAGYMLYHTIRAARHPELYGNQREEDSYR